MIQSNELGRKVDLYSLAALSRHYHLRRQDLCECHRGAEGRCSEEIEVI